ncbi:uncharacterized protein IL334_005140 [Kwoniella shivajii]|uniref:Zn(2)-C6 fungal-type domain-containing protein n=1 Tax=Kwoniella shivajii TaxID=564305 RepID=A0ABZ1D441_9TREE|nr:hypothetical protein IL334_005140 [Kwoniella shivajii]
MLSHKEPSISSTPAASSGQRSISPCNVLHIASDENRSINAARRPRNRRACDACRTKRLRCEYDAQREVCQRCSRLSIECQMLRPAPADQRLRAKRVRRRGATSRRVSESASLSDETDSEIASQSQGLEPRYLGSTSLSGLAALALELFPPSTRPNLNELDDQYSHFRITMCSGEEAVLIGRGASAATKRRPTAGSRTRGNEDAHFDGFGESIAGSVESEAVLLSHLPYAPWQPSPVSLGNVQVLLLLSLSAEMHYGSNDSSGGLSWLRVGMGIRMAQDIGLHREITSQSIPSQQLNRRRRVWAACVIADRWYAISFGRPMAINLLDSDTLEPSMYGDNARKDGTSRDTPFQVHTELAKLSILLGRVIRYAYSPFGMDLCTDDQLHDITDDLQNWRSGLAPSLELGSTRESSHAGLVNLLATCVELRAFLRPIKPIPVTVIYRPTRAQWDNVVARSGQAISWAAREGAYYLDTWFPVMYSLTWCFIVQLHAYVETKNEATLLLIQTKVVALVSILSSAAARLSEAPEEQAFHVFGSESSSISDTEDAAQLLPPYACDSSLQFSNNDFSSLSQLLPAFDEDMSVLNQFFFGSQNDWSYRGDTESLGEDILPGGQ